MCTFHCSAEQKISTDGAPSSRGFPDGVMDGDGWWNKRSGNRMEDTVGLKCRKINEKGPVCMITDSWSHSSEVLLGLVKHGGH